ncbi:MAG: hypothetical protein P4L82_16650 [Ancalomicrobiaceae bacterium]|nr:hypothetical protein [Ancalomicrobiaceae bacterium]
MSIDEMAQSALLIAKEHLTVEEMTRLIAATVGRLPTVAWVNVADIGEVSVALTTGKMIEMQAMPIARAFNQSMSSRRQALDDLVKRCA